MGAPSQKQEKQDGRATKNSKRIAAFEEQNRVLQEVLKASNSSGQNDAPTNSQESEVGKPSLESGEGGSPSKGKEKEKGVKNKATEEGDNPPAKKERRKEKHGGNSSKYHNDFYEEEDLVLKYPGHERETEIGRLERSGSNRSVRHEDDVQRNSAGKDSQPSDVTRRRSASETFQRQEHVLSEDEEERLDQEDGYLSGDSDNDDFLGGGEWDGHSISSSTIFPSQAKSNSRGDKGPGREGRVSRPGCGESGSRPGSQHNNNNGGMDAETLGNVIENLVKERTGTDPGKDLVGPAVADCIAGLLKTFLKDPSTEGVLKLLESYPRPENVEWLQSPTMGPQVAASIPKRSNNYDKRLRQSQVVLGGGIAAMARVLQDIMDRGKNDSSLLPLAKKVMDAMTLTGYVHWDFNAIRKGAIRQVVNPQYAGVFTRRTSSTPENLLGESSVPDQLKEYEEIGKVRAKLQKPKRRDDQRGDTHRGRGRGFSHSGGRGGFQNRGGHQGQHHSFGNSPQHFQNRGGRGSRPSYPQQRRVYGHQHNNQSDPNVNKDHKNL